MFKFYHLRASIENCKSAIATSSSIYLPQRKVVFGFLILDLQICFGFANLLVFYYNRVGEYKQKLNLWPYGHGKG